ncbi:MAG: histidine phosphatase family protein [Granulosicoccus sp.]
MRLHIVRHGQTDWNAIGRIQGQLDSQLDDTGIQQAIERGNDFDKSALAAIYASSSVRTRQTAHHILKGQDDDLILMDELREVRLGVWEGQMWVDIQKQYPEMVRAHWHASEAFEVEGAEKSSETQTRGIAAVESIIDRHIQGNSDDKCWLSAMARS